MTGVNFYTVDILYSYHVYVNCSFWTLIIFSKHVAVCYASCCNCGRPAQMHCESSGSPFSSSTIVF